MINKIKKHLSKKLKSWFHGRVLTADEALDLVASKPPSLWVINNSHVIDQSSYYDHPIRAELVFSKVPSVVDPVDQFPYPPIDDWAHRMHRQRNSQDELLASLKKQKAAGNQFVLRDTWLPQDVMSLIPVDLHSGLFGFKDFKRAIVKGHVLVVSKKLANSILCDVEYWNERDRLIYIEQAKINPELSIYTDEQLAKLAQPKFEINTYYEDADSSYGTITGEAYSVLDLKREQQEHTINMIRKFTEV